MKTAEITKPLLSGKVEDLSKIKYPVYATPKLDGIRVLKVNGKVVTRKFKELPNRFAREKLEELLPDGMDGEIMLTEGEDFNSVQSAIMSFDGEPTFTYHCFDYVKDDLDKPYIERMDDLIEWAKTVSDDRLFMVLPYKISNEKQLLEYEKQCLEEGYEGIMIRSAEGRYKCGRSTEKEGILLKIKKFYDSEATVVGFQEKMTNENVKEKDAFGNSKRSKKKEGLVPAGTLGALMVRESVPFPFPCNRGARIIEFNIGSGFDDATKQEIWDNRDKYLGKLVKYKYQEFGKDAPRFPVFLGFRHEDDVSE